MPPAPISLMILYLLLSRLPALNCGAAAIGSIWGATTVVALAPLANTSKLKPHPPQNFLPGMRILWHRGHSFCPTGVCGMVGAIEIDVGVDGVVGIVFMAVTASTIPHCSHTSSFGPMVALQFGHVLPLLTAGALLLTGADGRVGAATKAGMLIVESTAPQFSQISSPGATGC